MIEPSIPRVGARDADLVALYAGQFASLVAIATDEYRIDAAVADEIAHDVIIGALLHLPRMSDPRQWLRGAVRGAGEHYVRSRRA